MAMGQDRSRPGGPYVTAGLKKISGPSANKELHKKKVKAQIKTTNLKFQFLQVYFFPPLSALLNNIKHH